jgi:hypothetical protein
MYVVMHTVHVRTVRVVQYVVRDPSNFPTNYRIHASTEIDGV